MRKILILFISLLSLTVALQADFQGVYEGNYEEDTPKYGRKRGYFLARCDASNNVTIWAGNGFFADKYRFKISDQGVGSFKTSGGYKVTVQFSTLDDINLTLDKGGTASVTNLNKVDYPFTPGAALLKQHLMSNSTFYSNSPLELNLTGNLPIQTSIYTPEDQLSLLSGEWSIKGKFNGSDSSSTGFPIYTYPAYGRTVEFSLTGDVIITQGNLYIYAKASGEAVLIRQNASSASSSSSLFYGYFYNNVNLTNLAYNYTDRSISASGDAIVQGDSGTVSATIKQKVSYFDTDKDGLNDYDEINTTFTNPLKADSDGDRMSDYAELQAGTDPTDKSVYPAYLKVQVSLAKGIIADSDGDATVSIDGEPYAVSLVRGKGTLQVAMPIGSTYTVSASLGEALTSGDPRSVLLNKAATVSLVLDGDSDEDGLPDSLEARYKGKADNPDTDGDGIPDGAEVNTYRTRVDVADTDKDGLDDYEEINTTFTNPLKADSDGDRMSDYAELQAGTDPTDKSVYPAYLKVQVSLAKGIIADSDGDATVSIDGEPYAVSLVRGKGTLQVAMPIGSTYTVSASLGEALTSGDPRSVLLNKAATVSLVLDGDSDGDGLPDSLEARYKGDPNDEDTDDDGILDGAEVNTYGTRVDVADTDKDGFTDKQELDLNTNPLSSKDKPEAYIQRPVLVDLNLTYESANGYIVEKWDTAEMAYFLSSAVKDPQQGASIYLKYSLDGSNLKWIVRANGVDIDVSSLMRPIKVSKPAQLDGEVLSSINPLTGDYSVTQMFSLAISAGRTKSLSLVVSGESSFSAVGPNVSGLELDLATSSDYKALGMLKDSSMSDGPILIEGTLTMGDELANVLGQIIGSVETK